MLIVWIDRARGVPEHMAIDAALLEAVAGASDPSAVLRLYTFAPPGITLGRAQDPARELDLERCRAEGVAWAVRPTGGRAIWHDEDWTFAFAGPAGEGALAGAPREAYARTAAMLARALHTLGVPAALTEGSPGGPGAPRGGGGAASPCFASTARSELTLGGRKFAGIAQRESRGARLQQGSLLVGASHLRLVEFQRLEPARRPAERERLAAASSHLGEFMAAVPDFHAFARAVTAACGPAEVWRDAPDDAAWRRAGLALRRAEPAAVDPRRS